MTKIILSIILFLCISCFSASVNLSWDASLNTNVVSYNIFLGTNSGVYYSYVSATNNSIIISGLSNNTTYYFVATTLNQIGLQSAFGSEVSTTITNTNSINYIYIGMEVDYGTNISNLSSKIIKVTQKDSSLPYFYRAALTLTNKPVIGSVPINTNNYLYLVEQLQYGTNISFLTTEYYDLYCITNPPSNQFYRGSLVFTNNPF